MTTSDSEEFESADESVEVTSSGSRVGSKKGNPKTSSTSNAASKKTSSKKGPSAEEINKESSSGSSKPTKESEGTSQCESAIDEKKVFDMFDDKTSQLPANVQQKSTDDTKQKSSNYQRKQNTKDPRQSAIGRKLGSKLSSSPKDPVKDKLSDKPKLESSKIVDSSLKSENLKSSKVSETKDNSSDTKNEDAKAIGDHGWELEDGFEVPVANSAKPKHEDFEKELFPVLNKLSSLTTNAKNDQGEEKAPPSVGEGATGSGWSGWGGWGVSSILSTATESVSTLTSHVSAGLNTVLETGLGAPDPEVLAEVLEKEKEKEDKSKGSEVKPSAADSETSESVPPETTLGFGGLGQMLSGVSQLGTKVLSGGLDTLETLGKKTMEVLQDGDPGLRKKRALFFQDGDKPVLSQILREAKETADKSDKLEEEKQAAKRVHLETLFDDYQGLVHLEALEMLSNQCQIKLQSILLAMSGDVLKDMQETLEQVKELCELPDEEEDDDKDDDIDFKDKLTEAISQLCKDVPHSKIFEVSQRIDDWLKSDEAKTSSPVVVHEKAVASMAEFTSVSMEIFHRAAELLLIKLTHSTATEAECLTQITTILCIHVSRMATNFTMLLTENSESKENNKIITTIFMESAQCSSYIQDACRLVVPVLQVGAAE